MKRFYFLLLSCFLIISAKAIPLKTKNYHRIIIDTDCAIDDLRAISLLLARPEISIQAILVSDGSLPPAEGIIKIKSLLHEFNRDTIPVAFGNVLSGINPPWRTFNQSVKWGREEGFPATKLTALECLSEILNTSTERPILVCLGTLTNVAELVKKNASLLPKIERIVWYNSSVNPLQGFNYECDKESAAVVLESGVRIDIISNLGKENALFDTHMYEDYMQSNTQLAKTLYYVFSQKEVFKKLQENHFMLYDDLTVLYITNPELFDINVLKNKTNIRFNQDYNVQAVKEAISDMVAGTYISEQNIVFNRFPDQRGMFAYDVRQIVDTAIARYGKEEWKAIVMTDEFHGHLGVFSIVGAKMGIKARELFNVGPDMLDVLTYAGSAPPYSCMNDGIQVSTGATLGMGLIHLASDSITRPMAVFTYNNKSIRISLKPEYLTIVKSDINEGIVKYGLMDDGYWKLIRHNAIKYWVDWNRNDIFDIEVL